jgi:hypothetical protein
MVRCANKKVADGRGWMTGDWWFSSGNLEKNVQRFRVLAFHHNLGIQKLAALPRVSVSS